MEGSMTFFSIASSSVRYSLMETGSLWLLSLRKKSISIGAFRIVAKGKDETLPSRLSRPPDTPGLRPDGARGAQPFRRAHTGRSAAREDPRGAQAVPRLLRLGLARRDRRAVLRQGAA